MESLARRIAAWPAWGRKALTVSMAGALWALVVLTLSWPGVWPRVLCLVLLAVWTWLTAYVLRAISCMEAQGELRREDRRYLREFVPVMVAYCAIMLFVWPLLKSTDAMWLKALIALSPAVPVACLAFSMYRYVTASDEFMQRLHLQALAVAAGVVGVLSMVAGFLAAAKVVALDGDVLTFVFPALCVTYAFALAWAKRRYRD